MSNNASDPGEPKGLVVLCSHAIGDPLVATLMLDYLLVLQNEVSGRNVLLFTEEPTVVDIPTPQYDKLRSAGISWVPLHYDPKASGQWRRKLGNWFRIFRHCRRFLSEYPGSSVLGFLSMAGAYAALLRMVLPFEQAITLCFEPHSAYMREMGVWSPLGPKYLVMRALERLQMNRMDVLVVPTKAGLTYARKHGRKGSTPMLGVTIDVASCAFDPVARRTIRGRYGFGSAPVLVYVGKFGDIYHDVDQYMAFMRGVSSVVPACRFMVITQTAWSDAIQTHPYRASLGDHLVVVPPVPPDRLKEYLSAADLGVVAIPPTPSHAFRTPVKTAHYWAAGLPIIIPRGVSDDHRIAEEEGTGIVVDDLPVAGNHHLAQQMERFGSMDAGMLRQRCMDCAFRHRDTSLTVDLLKDLLQ